MAETEDTINDVKRLITGDAPSSPESPGGLASCQVDLAEDTLACTVDIQSPEGFDPIPHWVHDKIDCLEPQGPPPLPGVCSPPGTVGIGNVCFSTNPCDYGAPGPSCLPDLCQPPSTVGIDGTCFSTNPCDYGLIGPGCLPPLNPCDYNVPGPDCLPPPPECDPGKTYYEGKYGSWCAGPAEIAQDSIDDDPVPVVKEDDGSALDAADGEPFTDVEFAHPDNLFLLLNAPFQTSCNTPAGTCDVVFIHGIAGNGGVTTAGYGSWDALYNYYQDGGYTIHMLDYYGGDCESTETIVDHGDHDNWFAGHHASGGAGCDGSNTIAHDRNTDLRHLAYHLAWWLWDTYGPDPVDVVAHSMGGLMLRYAMAMVGHDTSFPATLNVQDVTTLATPHKGSYWACDTTLTEHRNMCPYKNTMKWMEANAQDPQGLEGTDWTLMGADDDIAVSSGSATGMAANHKVIYPNDTGGNANTAYEHEDYFQDGSTANDGDTKWSDYGATWYKWGASPHSVVWAYRGSVDPTW